jgi:adenylate cyclase
MTRDELCPSTTNAPDSAEIRRHLERILASSAFVHASRAQQFLRFVIEETVAGRASDITEPVVAAQVFKLGDDFDRRSNSIVRAEATHVRRRLRDYYLGMGGSDSVIIDLPRGGYVPSIRFVASGGSKPQAARWTRLAALVSLLRPGKAPPRG